MTLLPQYRSVQLALFAAVGVSLTGCEALKNLTSDCKSPETLLDDEGDPTGYEQCADGTINRVEVVTVALELPGETCEGTEADLQCTTDSDCTAWGIGRCITGDHDDDSYYGGSYYDTGADSSYCGCIYGCTTDADCPEDEACVPPGILETGADWPTCERVDCATNDDCESEECSLTSYHDGCSYSVSLSCRDSSADDCRTDDDCMEGDYCVPAYSGEGYVCESTNCAIGRPLLVDGAARTGLSTGRRDWIEGVGVSVAGLNRKTRRALVKHWAGVAAMEHASVASFARFSLQLMALGAPPELLLETQAAGADEVRHAQTTFGIASEYAGAPIGPGPLSLDGVTMDTDVIGILRGLVMEACVGETLGVAEAIAAADATTDPALESALRQIAEDETRHSALAWKTLKWMLEENPALRPVAADAFEEAIDELLTSEMEGPEGLGAYGVLSPERRREVYREAAEVLVRPCAAQLTRIPPAVAVAVAVAEASA